jgi:hypothetical protein
MEEKHSFFFRCKQASSLLLTVSTIEEGVIKKGGNYKTKVLKRSPLLVYTEQLHGGLNLFFRDIMKDLYKRNIP